MVGSSSSLSKWTFAFFGGKLHNDLFINQSHRANRLSHFSRGSKAVKPMTMLLGTEPALWRLAKDDQN
jgi:hypothetical protein